VAQIYGSWLADKPTSKKFKRRLGALSNLASKVVFSIESDFPALKGKLYVSHPNLLIAVGRYFNDVARMKAAHKLKKINRPKIAAYTIKWVTKYPVIVCPIDQKSLARLTTDQRRCIFNANFTFFLQLIDYFLALEKNSKLTDHEKDEVRKTVRYLTATDQFDAKNFAFLFEVIDPDPKRADLPKVLNSSQGAS